MALSTETLKRAQTSKVKRLDIQGLRAVAVLAVVINHTFGFPAGGFVGVDIFFVISGFVITGLLLRERDRTGTISFRSFYLRRVKRILPASILALVVTVTVSYFVYLAGRASSILVDGLWALLFSGNWRFASNGTDYWAQDTPVSPLQHYWSLGVEEQFYFIWPALIVAVLWVVDRASRNKARGRLALLCVLAALCALSFAWALNETKSNPTWAYFSTISRAWELAVGAFLAVGAGLLSRIPRPVRTFMAWVGIAGIVTSLLVITKEVAFPAPWAALPVVATALIIGAGTGGQARGLGVLTNKGMTYVGDLSYSLYLWHFPVVILLETLTPVKDLTFYLTALGAISVLTLVSYHFWEQPFLNGFKKPGQSGRVSREGLVALSALVIAAAITTNLSLTRGATEVEAAAVVYAPAPATPTAESADTNQSKLTTQINAALGASEWPALTPALDNVLSEGKPEEDSAGCGQTDLYTPTCSWDTGKPATAIVLGDSTGITLLPTVRAALGDEYNIRGMTMAGCLSLDLAIKDDRPELVADCAKFKQAAIDEIIRIKPEIVFLTNTSGVLGLLASGTPEAQAGSEWREGTVNQIRALAPSGAKIVVVTGPPSGKPPAICATRASTPKDCQYELPRSFTVTAQATKEATGATGAAMIDTSEWFCSAGQCPAFVGDVPVKRDGVHTTKQYALVLASVFKDALKAAA